MFEERGVHRAVAQQLVRRYGAGAVRAQIEHYDQVSARDGPAPAPGWLVKAIRESYALPPQRTACSTRFTYQQMLAWCEARGDYHLTQLFTPVKEGEKTFFMLAEGRGQSAVMEHDCQHE